jgi:two-component system, NarL family, response regulator LiaR
MGEDKIHIAIVDDHKVVRKGLEVFLEIHDDFVLVGEVSTAKELYQICTEKPVDVVLMDLIMPDVDGIEATKVLQENHPDVQVVALTSYVDEDLIRRALRAGVISYVLKNTDVNELANTIRLAHAGQSTLSPEALKVLFYPEESTSKAQLQNYNLTDREREILIEIISGAGNRQIAKALNISLSTVKFHVSTILNKLSVSSRTEAATVAIQNGLVDLDGSNGYLKS